MITHEKAKTSKFAYLKFLICQPSWIKIDRNDHLLGYPFLNNFYKSWLFYPKVRYHKMVLYQVGQSYTLVISYPLDKNPNVYTIRHRFVKCIETVGFKLNSLMFYMLTM